MVASASTSMLPDAIYEELRASILAQQDAPGSTLTESGVALRFGVARPTAKVAIEKLVTEGLLRREKNQAARVPLLTRNDVVDLLDARAVIEGAAVSSLATNGTIPADALSAHRSIQRQANSRANVASLDIAFHRALVTGQSNLRIQRMHALLMGEIELCIGQVLAGRLRTATDVASEHQAILDAITAGEPGRAERLTHDHIAVTRERLLEHFEHPQSAR
jgi:DNA-binding GntR family transcriptional regulator